MLTLEGLRLSQGNFVLRADLIVPRGERVAVLGPSGAGKSTLLAAIGGFLAPAEGRILWDDVEITQLEPGQRPLSVIFQDNNLFPHLTAWENVALGLAPSLKPTAKDRDRVTRSLERVGLAGLGEQKPGRLSGGQQSRVALARVLLRHRPLLLLDEPFSALGPALKAEMLDLVAMLCAEGDLTVLMVTHDPADARIFAGKTILVVDGIAHPPRGTADLLDNPPPALAGYLGKPHG